MPRRSNPFTGDSMAAGYATAPPPVHPRVVERIAAWLEAESSVRLPVRRALDLGCGAGLSTAPLKTLARHVTGVEPAVAMLPWARRVAPMATFTAGAAEHLPLASASVNFITAAGSLNYTDLDRVWPEAARVLTGDGLLVAYDFSPGRTFPDDPALDAWYDRFEARYPRPTTGAVALDPGRLAVASSLFRLIHQEAFDIDLEMSPGAYESYVLTETSVASAVERGDVLDDIQAWCRQSLREVFGECARIVRFRGYIAILRRT